MFDIHGMDLTAKLNWRDERYIAGQLILVIDDDPISRRIVTNFLKRKDIKYIEAKDGEEGFEKIMELGATVSIVLVDWMMPKMDGITLIKTVRESDEFKEKFLYCILVTSKDEKSDVLTGFEAGADDYVTKPFDLNELWARIMTGLRVRRLMMELANKNRALTEMALKDPLTQLLNRRALDMILNTEIARTLRGSKVVSVCMIDIDFFKKVNDTYGHDVGDLVLKSVAGTLESNIRMMDTISRFGGEEFVIIFPEMSQEGCEIAGERLRSAVEKTSIKLNEKEIFVTISLGFSTCSDLTCQDDGIAMLKVADECVYEAKSKGRNCFVIRKFCE